MRLDLQYLGKSEVRPTAGGAEMRFSPNLARSKVFFDGELAHAVRFREAMSALHDVVIGDQRFQKKDKTAYAAWKKAEAGRDAEIRRQLTDRAKRDELAKIMNEPPPANLDADFRKQHALYWRARRQWAAELSANDPELFRHLVPCDPVVTVAPDVVFFECFSKDESAYGCLSVDREALRSGSAGLGTTNVDYSIGLYDHFQTLRSYRSTRLLVDPTGFEVKVAGSADYREEKIDLPPSWLRGFGQLQAAMTLPSRKVELTVEAVYSLLAYLKRHRERTGPRSIRFQLSPGKAPVLVLDPWGVTIPCKGAVIDDAPAAAFSAGMAGQGPYRAAPARPHIAAGAPEEIKVWGRRRLFALARVLPLCERIEVRLLGSGLPSIWIAHMGEMRFVLALSGWTANDWTSGSTLEMLAGSSVVDARLTDLIEARLRDDQRETAERLAEQTGARRETVLSSLHQLAKQGQAIYDFSEDCYRYRQVMPAALSEAVLGPEHPELAEGRKIALEKRVKVLREEALGGGRRLYVFEAAGTSSEAVVDTDGAFKKAKCECSFFYKSRLRAGPCRHLVALKLAVLDVALAKALPEAKAANAASNSGADKPAVAPAPAPAPARPPGSARKSPRRDEVVSFAKDVLAEIRKRADDEDRGISEVVEDAWDLAFERVQSCRGWKDAVKLVEPSRADALAGRSVNSSVQQTVLLHEDVLREIGLVSDRFDASPSATVNLAWLVAETLR